MLVPIKVVDLELSRPLPNLSDLDGYVAVKGLVRLQGVPIGYIDAPVIGGACTAATLGKKIVEAHSTTIIERLVEKGLLEPGDEDRLRLERLLALDSVSPLYLQGPPQSLPVVTVAVCTRDRPDDLARCLDALVRLDYPQLDLLVVDNAPSTDGTANLVKGRYPEVRYVCEPRPGLDWARNRAILEAKGEILAYTDDDVVVDSLWVSALAKVFADNREVMCVTGLVVPYELETEAQWLFEANGGFGRGFRRRWWRVPEGKPVPWQMLGTGQFGTGANMAFRRSVFDQIGFFDPALDVGTPTNGGGDLEMYFRVLKGGHTLVYEPCALVRHGHRREYAQLKRQLTHNGSVNAFWWSVAQTYPEQRKACARIVFWWLKWVLRRWLMSWTHPKRFPRELISAELGTGFAAIRNYRKAVRRANEIEAKFGPQSESPPPKLAPRAAPPASRPHAVAIRPIELLGGLAPLSDVGEYDAVRLIPMWRNRPLGTVDLTHQRQIVSRARLAEVISASLGLSLIEPGRDLDGSARWALGNNAVRARFCPDDRWEARRLAPGIPVSVIVATYDRPEDLRNCLAALAAQRADRPVEVLVVDNHPQSGLTPPVVADFPRVRLVSESRQGLSYARNAGILAATGEILIATDDDVTMPQDWVETLVAPFARPDVMVVTGNVLPLELDTPSQQAFETYGGLGRGYETFEKGSAWYEKQTRQPVKTWNLGATANAAFRASIFADPRIGLIYEALGAGMPSGCSEDTYVFYKVLKAGYTIIYQPDAYVWHKHRRDGSSLERQLFNYSKGHVGYHLTTWLKDGDWRALKYLLIGLPSIQIRRIRDALLKRSNYPLSLVFVEIKGNLAGPWALWQSVRRVRREGSSGTFVLRAQPTAESKKSDPPNLATAA